MRSWKPFVRLIQSANAPDNCRHWADKPDGRGRGGERCDALQEWPAIRGWLGLVPRQHSTGGKPHLLGISKRGDIYLRKLFVHGGAPRYAGSGSRTTGEVSGSEPSCHVAVPIAPWWRWRTKTHGLLGYCSPLIKCTRRSTQRPKVARLDQRPHPARMMRGTTRSDAAIGQTGLSRRLATRPARPRFS